MKSMPDDVLRAVLELIVQAISDLQTANIHVPASLHKAVAALTNELKDDPTAAFRPMGQS
jgi:hypothetical protein